MDQDATGASGEDMGDLDPEKLGYSMDYRTYAALTVVGSDTMQGPTPCAAGTTVCRFGKGASNSRGDQQVQWGTH